MSDRFTASALCPRFSGSSSGKKCGPGAIVWLETGTSRPAVMGAGAQSAATPRPRLEESGIRVGISLELGEVLEHHPGRIAGIDPLVDALHCQLARAPPR